MKNQLTVFPAIFTFDGKYYNVDFIDLKGCSTFGNSIQDAYAMAQDAMGLYLDNMVNFPKPSLDFSAIDLKDNQFISLISIDMDDYRKKFNNKAVKKTLTIPKWLNYLAEKNNINFSQVLQEAIKEKLNID
ncbi:MAG: type II toxin-antitoxin system HicB family antitoxin [Clostridia bacterium]|jgi:antitoxin HicB